MLNRFIFGKDGGKIQVAKGLKSTPIPSSGFSNAELSALKLGQKGSGQ